ncbi:hypothetical protein [Pedobacter flavus]|uniref:DUF3592 domain-containing protein n=1 Tax=Pedobacter flavus TaxID=3113906 RepID=A0ABU7GZ01_9SPHI|nr:hypothetical protein [Pedobacter sp. VNH31]MEE1884211.1 hypothetical protein [Pedobacter sp. VNH31]
MRIIGVIFIILGILAGLLGVQSYLRDDAYAKASTTVKAFVKSAEVKPMSGKAVGSIRLVLAFLRDGVEDTLEYSYSEAFSINDPLSTVEELKSRTPYVRYVPKEKRSKNMPDWVMVSNKDKHDGAYGQTGFSWMLKFLIVGIFLIFYSRVRRKNRETFRFYR